MWTTRSPGVSRSRMSRGTTRRIAFGRRTRTEPNSSRSVTNASPSGPPTNPPFRLRSTRATAPGGGGASTRLTAATGRPASPRTSDSRAAWSEARTIRWRSSAQASTASTIRPARSPGTLGSRQPNRSPELSPPPAIASDGSDSQVSSSVRAPSSRAFQSRGGRYVCGPVLRQVAGRDEVGLALVGLAPQERAGLGQVAGLVEDEERAGFDVVEPGRRADDRGPDLGGVAGVERSRRGSGRVRDRCCRAGRPRTARARLHALEAGEVGREPLRQPGRPTAEARPELAGAARGNEELAGRQERGAFGGPDGPLVGRVEPPDRVDLVAEEVDPDRKRLAGREDVDDPAAPGELARDRRPRASAGSRGRAARGGARRARSAPRPRGPAARPGDRSGSSVRWRSAWTLATRIRARPVRHAASAATRAAVSSATSSLRS